MCLVVTPASHDDVMSDDARTDAPRRPARRHHRRGHPIVSFARGPWRWAATGRFLKMGSNPDDPACVLCGQPPTVEGYDACIGYIPGAVSACCGHGVTTGHVTYKGAPRIDMPVCGAVVDTYPFEVPDRPTEG
jgi:hypothetical protein